MKIDEKIRQNRLKTGMTQEQLAKKLGVSAQSVSKWENSVAMPDIMLLPDLAEVFGISIDAPSAVPRWMVANSRITVRSPIST